MRLITATSAAQMHVFEPANDRRVQADGSAREGI